MQYLVLILLLNLSVSFATTPNPKKKSGMTSEKAMSLLKKGNARYLAGERRTDGQDESVRQKQKTKEAPHTVVIACSDSRVPPEIVFDQRPGEIYVVRVAGEALDHSVLASVEYAIKDLNAKNVFVLGHTSCDTVKTAVTTKEGTSSGSEHLDAVVNDIRPRLKTGRNLASEPTKNVEVESATNAQGIAGDLPTRSKLVKEAVEAGKIGIHWGLYHIDTGVVDFH